MYRFSFSARRFFTNEFGVSESPGSMGSQIEGVKQAVRELIPLLAENPSLGIVIIAFTEGGRYVFFRHVST